MREMEKAVLLQILDSSWMEHLRAMDHLRSSIGLQGYAQIDPKVEYKREGMRIFAEMWNGIGDRVTDLIFRVEQFDPEFLNYLGSQWQARPRPDDPPAGRVAARRQRRPAGASASSKTPPSPAASSPPKRNASPSATLQKRSVATTPARADPVKNSKPATCANNPRATHFDRSLWFTQFSHSLTIQSVAEPDDVGGRPARGSATCADMICRCRNDLGAEVPASRPVAGRRSSRAGSLRLAVDSARSARTKLAGRLRSRHGSCLNDAGPVRVKGAAPFRERIPRDAIRAECDLLRRPGLLLAAAVLPMASRGQVS